MPIKDNLKEINAIIFLDMDIFGLCQTDYAFGDPDLFVLESFFSQFMMPVERATQMPLGFYNFYQINLRVWRMLL